jgi:hypothetical protein
MIEAINSKRMGAIDYKKKDRTDQVMEVARAALEASVGYVDSSFFTDERLKMMKELSLNH